MISCKETVGGEVEKDGDLDENVSVSAADSSRTITNTFSTTWSYQTSDDPKIAGEDSDVFVGKSLQSYCYAIIPFEDTDHLFSI